MWEESVTMLDRQSPTPLHMQLEDIIRHKIENESWPQNANIPSENELSKMYGISRMTVRSVLNRIVTEGLLYRVPGKGTFVSEPKTETQPFAQEGMRELVEHITADGEAKLLSVDMNNVSAWIAHRLGLSADEPVYVVRRMLYTGANPFGIHTSYVSPVLCPDLASHDLMGKSLKQIWENDYGHEIIKRMEVLASTTANQDEAKLLGLKVSSPLLMLESALYTHREAPVEYAKIIFRTDRIKLRMEFNK